MTLFIAWPWLALVPAVILFSAYLFTRRLLLAGTAAVWLAYAIYEYAMKRRWLCTGECNIRVDLLLVYPVLVVLTVIAAVVAIRAAGRRPPGA